MLTEGVEKDRSTVEANRLLSRELERRCRQNPKYSLRAFAKALEINPSMLSMVISGKRNLSSKSAKKIAEKLGFNPVVSSFFVDSATKLTKKHVTLQISEKFRELSLDQFATISSWYHYGILSLIETRDFKPSCAWIASRLGITPMEAKSAVERLKRLNILDVSKPRWVQIGEPIMIENSVSTSATRHFHKEILRLAQYSLENDSPATRDISSVTMALDVRDMPIAIEEIRKFRVYLMHLLAKKKTATEVYQLAIQLYPASRRKK